MTSGASSETARHPAMTVVDIRADLTFERHGTETVFLERDVEPR